MRHTIQLHSDGHRCLKGRHCLLGLPSTHVHDAQGVETGRVLPVRGVGGGGEMGGVLEVWVMSGGG